MLEEFSTVKLDSAKSPEPAPVTATAPTETAKATAAPTTEPQANAEDAFSEDDFAKQLQAGMADLLGELEKSVCQQKLPVSNFLHCAHTANSPICKRNSRISSSR